MEWKSICKHRVLSTTTEVCLTTAVSTTLPFRHGLPSRCLHGRAASSEVTSTRNWIRNFVSWPRNIMSVILQLQQHGSYAIRRICSLSQELQAKAVWEKLLQHVVASPVCTGSNRPLLLIIVYPNEGGVAGYGNRTTVKYTAKWGLQIAEMIFQTLSSMDQYKIGSGTLSLIMERYHAGGIPIEELQMMPPKEVELLFILRKILKRRIFHFQISSTTMIGFMPQTVE